MTKKLDIDNTGGVQITSLTPKNQIIMVQSCLPVSTKKNQDVINTFHHGNDKIFVNLKCFHIKSLFKPKRNDRKIVKIYTTHRRNTESKIHQVS